MAAFRKRKATAKRKIASLFQSQKVRGKPWLIGKSKHAIG
jgi:hypothetical protein